MKKRLGFCRSAKTQTVLLFLFLFIVTMINAQQKAAPNEWMQFRGPNGAGVYETTGLPLEFGPEKNVIWKTDMPTGYSSPVLTEKYIFLTSF
jgi:hypothetical protein